MLFPFKLIPSYREYIWGGNRLRPNLGKTAEAWIVYEDNEIADGPYAGTRLGEVAEKNPIDLLGPRILAQSGSRFPLLIKLLDCADWLSLQVHPNNEQAEKLEGPGHLGKTEAWYVVEADEGAQLLGGFRTGVTSDDVLTSLSKGGIIDLVKHHAVQTGDAIFIPAGLIHALGPGLLIYEVQQTSDITYRVYDWDRPMTSGRKLHLDQAGVVLNPDLDGRLISASSFKGDQKISLVTSSYFTLELITGEEGSLRMDTQGESFAVFTLLNGKVIVRGGDWRFELDRFETLLIPAVCGAYQLEFMGSVRGLNAFVP